MSDVPAALTANDIRVEDNDPAVSYNGDWIPLSDPSVYTGSSYHLSHTQGSSATLTFTGQYVWLISDSNTNHGTFVVQIDDAVPTPLSSYSSSLRSQQVLYGTAVSPGPHTFTVVNSEDKALGIDQFVYRPVTFIAPPTSPSNPSQSSTPSTTPAPAQHGPHLPTGAVAGIVLSILSVLVLFGLFVLIVRDNRLRQRLRQQQLPPPVTANQGYIFPTHDANSMQADMSFRSELQTSFRTDVPASFSTDTPSSLLR